MKAMTTFIILFSIDNVLVIFFPIQPVFGNYHIVPYLLLISIVVSVFYDEKNHAPWLALIFGLIYDTYSTNLLGIYAVLFPSLVILMKKYVVPVTPINFVSIFYVSTVSILAAEVIIYLLVMLIIPARALSITSTIDFIQHRLMITLMFNMSLLAVIYLPLVKFLKPKHEKKVKTIMMDNTAA
ncbi:MAG: rod shape-determining protein MreD [Defluviitaleaceae bacterium]|nr:rod shape-determining protein MreD [Defluviitaleaceae bacterium]